MPPLSLLPLLGTLALAQGQARAPHARLEHVSGKVTVAGAAVRAAKAGAEVFDGETVKTGPRASAILAFPDGSRVKLRADSAFKAAVPADEGGVKGGLLTLGGAFASVIKGRPGHFRLRTPTAVASVRGTEFFAAYGRGQDLWVCVGKGAIDLAAGPGPGVVVKEGEGVLLPGGRKTTKPRPYGWTKGLNWNMDPASGAVEDATDLDAAYGDLRDQDYR